MSRCASLERFSLAGAAALCLLIACANFDDLAEERCRNDSTIAGCGPAGGGGGGGGGDDAGGGGGGGAGGGGGGDLADGGDAGAADAGGGCDAGLTDCGGGCVDLSRASGHCGWCGRSCGALACDAGQCPTQAIAQTLHAPRDLATGEGLVVVGQGSFSFCGGQPVRVYGDDDTAALRASFSVSTMGGGSNCAWAVKVHNGRIYAANFARAGAFHLDGGLAFSAASSGYHDDIDVTAAGAVWGAHDPICGLYAATTTLTGAAPLLSRTCSAANTAPKVNDVVRTANYVWFGDRDTSTTSRYARMMSPDGGGLRLVTAVAAEVKLATDRTFVVVGEMGAPGRVLLYGEDGGFIAQLGVNDAGLTDVAIDAEGAYWAGTSGSGTTFYMAPRDGGATRVLATDPGPINSIAVSDGWLYWVTDTNATDAFLRRVGK